MVSLLKRALSSGQDVGRLHCAERLHVLAFQEVVPHITDSVNLPFGIHSPVETLPTEVKESYKILKNRKNKFNLLEQINQSS